MDNRSFGFGIMSGLMSLSFLTLASALFFEPYAAQLIATGYTAEIFLRNCLAIFTVSIIPVVFVWGLYAIWGARVRLRVFHFGPAIILGALAPFVILKDVIGALVMGAFDPSLSQVESAMAPDMARVAFSLAGCALVGMVGIRLTAMLFQKWALWKSENGGRTFTDIIGDTWIGRLAPVEKFIAWSDARFDDAARRRARIAGYWTFSLLPLFYFMLTTTGTALGARRESIVQANSVVPMLIDLCIVAAFVSLPSLVFNVLGVHYRRRMAVGPLLSSTMLGLIYTNYWLISGLLLAARGGIQSSDFSLTLAYDGKIALICGAVWAALFMLGLRMSFEFVRDGHSSLGTKQQGKNSAASRLEGLSQDDWADRRTVRQQLGKEGGIVLGELTNPYDDTPNFNPRDRKSWGKQGKGPLITLDPNVGNGHVMVISESSGFKSSGVVIPNLLTYQGPVVVLDPKGTIYEQTKDARIEMGFNPIKIDHSDGLDPFQMLKPLIDSRPSNYISIANFLVEKMGHSDNEYFRERSVDLMTALLYHAMQIGSTCVPATVLDLLSGDMASVLDRAEALSALYPKDKVPFVYNAFERAKAIDERGFDSFIRPISNKLKFAEFADTSGYVTEPEGVNKYKTALGPKTDIYINIPTDTLRAFPPLIRLILGSILLGAQASEKAGAPGARRLIIIDEAKSLGNLDILPMIRDEGRDYGLHLMMIYQNWGEVVRVWQKEGAESWMDTTDAKIYGWVQSKDRTEDLVAMLGTQHKIYETKSRSLSSNSESLMKLQSGTTVNEQIKEIPLLSKSKLNRLPRHGALIFTRDVRPICGTKAIYFTRNEMVKRVK